MRASALPLLLLLVAGCASPAPTEAALESDAERASRAAGDGDLPALVVMPGSPFTWKGSTDACTGLKMPYSCAGQSFEGSDAARIAIGDEVQAVRLTVAWIADSDASTVLDVMVFAGSDEVARASGPSPIELRLEDLPEQLRVLVRLPEPEVARAGDGSSQAFEGLAEAVA